MILGHASAIRSLMNHYYFDLSALYIDNSKKSSALDIALENDHYSPDFLVFLSLALHMYDFIGVFKECTICGQTLLHLLHDTHFFSSIRG